MVVDTVVHQGDCRDVVPDLGLHQSLITDPPFEMDFGAGYGNATWDFGPDVETWATLLQVIEPGRFAAVFAPPATVHHVIDRLQRAGWQYEDMLCWLFGQGMPKAKTRLKPAWLPIVLCRRPGKPIINLGGVREGRWPANVLLDTIAAENLDSTVGVLKSGSRKAGTRSSMGYHGGGEGDGGPAVYGDEGGPSRFFYVAKVRGKARDHPTAKPVALLQWLVRLLTFPGERVLDPFAGTGSTLIAAQTEGRTATGIELMEKYADVAQAKLQ